MYEATVIQRAQEEISNTTGEDARAHSQPYLTRRGEHVAAKGTERNEYYIIGHRSSKRNL